MSGLTFDAVNFINIFFGAVFGGVISALISYYFFLKGKGLETVAQWTAQNLGEIFIKQAHPQFFGKNSTRVKPLEAGPKNLDVPRLTTVICYPEKPQNGEFLEILCRVSDESWNFPMASGLTILDANLKKYSVENAEFGYMYAKIPVIANQGVNKYILEFHMQDQPSKGLPNTFMQTIELPL